MTPLERFNYYLECRRNEKDLKEFIAKLDQKKAEALEMVKVAHQKTQEAISACVQAADAPKDKEDTMRCPSSSSELLLNQLPKAAPVLIFEEK